MLKRILLIEDDELIRENTAEILELSGYEVLTAKNGKDGVKVAIDSNVNLIISDIMMPELDGYGVLKVLSKNPKTSTIPFIFLSARSEKTDIRHGMGLGADDYLTKPFEEADLLDAIEARFKKVELLDSKSNFSGNLDHLNQLTELSNPSDSLDNLIDEGSIVAYKAKSNLYHAGDSPQFVYYIKEGKVKLYTINDDGKEHIVNVCKEGDFFGYEAILANEKYSKTSVALEKIKVIKINIDAFLNLISGSRDVASRFIRMLSGNTLEKERQLLSFAYDTVRKRAANALIHLADKLKDENSEELKIKVTRDDIASVAGTATETLIRCLSDFKDDGLIETEGRSIVILDYDSLKNFAY